MTKISIIGAGPAGNYLAYLLAKNSFDVSVFEEHETVGMPVQCTGITTSYLGKLVELKKNFVINRINKARIFAPNNRFIDVRLDNNIILDRAKFDQYLMEKAKKAGAKFFLGRRFVDFKKGIMKIQKVRSKIIDEIKTDYLVGADGPLSDVAKSAGLKGKMDFLIGIQARVRLNNQNIVEFYPFIEKYAWVVPESKDIVRIGLATRKKPKKALNDFLRKRLKRYEIINMQAGLIPVYNPKLRTQKGNVFLVGDAASMVKATTGGGIIQGLIAARALADAIINKKNYNKEWKKAIGRDLLMHFKMRNIMNKFSAKDWDYLIELFNKEKLKKILASYDRDFPSRFLVRLALIEPRLLYFLKHIV
ncbi:hypothetical protein AUJ10_03465 [Candidatus Pacearchaeota archaeon CG1_02_31_27]|nr:MAG: hypothetical protein AUJ10_03465 [Candidatus Pacearchaeota archaeon CG1_02_31_27]